MWPNPQLPVILLSMATTDTEIASDVFEYSEAALQRCY